LPRRVERPLTDSRVKAIIEPGRYFDGGGLILLVKEAGTKSWVYRFTLNNRRREMGLGSFPNVSLARARQRRNEALQVLLDNKDPIAERSTKDVPSFAQAVEQFLSERRDEWRNEKHKAQWITTLSTYCKPITGKPVNEVDTTDVMRVLKPIWGEKNETASRLRGRIERVLDYAAVHGWREGDNPARWRGHLKDVLPARKKLSRGHHAAIDYRQLPEFMAVLRSKVSISAVALEFLILAAARTGEVIGARHDEINEVESV
jgi:hypothetical protein